MNDEYGILSQAVKLLDKKMAIDMVCLDVSDLTILSHYFVICTGGSTSQINALCDELREKMAPYILKVEGKEESGWVIIQLDGVMVHVFSRQMRDYYSLEHLWEDTVKIDISKLLEEGAE